MNVLLTGASGFIGRNLAAALVSAGHCVTPASRSKGFDFCRMLSPGDWSPHLRGIDVVINSVGIIGETGRQRFKALHELAPSALFRACAEAGVRRVLQISALGADESAFSAYHLSKRAADDTLRGLDLDWFVLRPSLIYGLGGKSAGLFMRLAKLPMIPVIGNGQQMIQPVHISDVIATLMQCLSSPEPRQTLDIVGTETISFAEWLQTMRRAQGLPRAPILRFPFRLAMLLTGLGRHFSPMLRAENLRMLQTGVWADFRPLIRFLGRPPLTIKTSLFFTNAN
ncbi:MAG: complex I NDUFA9 subunit family protein [Betaproteobacteria bacterium]|nr:complex I NDUFA9 subunit family protein [Betaproteobacteria bacterium]